MFDALMKYFSPTEGQPVKPGMGMMSAAQMSPLLGMTGMFDKARGGQKQNGLMNILPLLGLLNQGKQAPQGPVAINPGMIGGGGGQGIAPGAVSQLYPFLQGRK